MHDPAQTREGGRRRLGSQAPPATTRTGRVDACQRFSSSASRASCTSISSHFRHAPGPGAERGRGARCEAAASSRRRPEDRRIPRADEYYPGPASLAPPSARRGRRATPRSACGRLCTNHLRRGLWQRVHTPPPSPPQRACCLACTGDSPTWRPRCRHPGAGDCCLPEGAGAALRQATGPLASVLLSSFCLPSWHDDRGRCVVARWGVPLCLPRKVEARFHKFP